MNILRFLPCKNGENGFRRKFHFLARKKNRIFCKNAIFAIFGGIFPKKYFCEAKYFFGKKEVKNSLRFLDFVLRSKIKSKNG